MREPALALVGGSTGVLARAEAAGLHFTAQEHARAGAFRDPAARVDYLAAHALVRMAAAAVSGMPACSLTLLQRCADCGGPHGQARIGQLPGLHVSLSHTKGVVIGAAATRPVGVDVERWSSGRSRTALAEFFLAPGELRAMARNAAAAAPAISNGRRDVPSAADMALVRLWTRKEALVKLGATTLLTMRSCDLSSLPLDEPQQPQGRLSQLNGRYFCDWADDALAVAGAVVCEAAPLVIKLVDDGKWPGLPTARAVGSAFEEEYSPPVLQKHRRHTANTVTGAAS